MTNSSQAEQQKNWWTFDQSSQINPLTFFDTYRFELGLSQESTFEPLAVEVDNLGISHSKYQQFQYGVKVEGAQFILHSKNNAVYKANGRLVNAIQGSASPSLDFQTALQKAKAITGASVFYWEVPAMEAWLKDAKHDKNATFYPKEELVWVDPDFSQDGENYKLAYKVDLFFEATEDHRTLFIDAHTGQLVWENHRCHTGVANGQAKTRYSGIQDIITDSIAPNQYILKDVTRGGGIETYNALRRTRVASAVNFLDSNNYWDNANVYIDDAATDAHWGAEMTYDYFWNQHGRNSYDNLGSKLISYVHWDSAWFNASWNGIAMRYGDGNGNPLISIDVVGHELAHGVTEYTADLIYSYESGALNESFSDIFGTAIEFYTMPDSADWAMGMLDFHLRQLDNPKSAGDPDTYKGINWNFTSSDNGGVHTNSGVQNYWFYLLSEGGSGTNDLGNSYQVDSIGIEKASEIAYRNLSYYLVQSSNYFDARRGSISAAEDIYGSCSYEANLVARAWYAVGIGSDTLSNDIELLNVVAPKNSCDIGAQETMAVQFQYFRSGCDSAIAAGDSISLGYSINGGPSVVETLVLTAPINDRDIVSYSFNTKADFITAGNYYIKHWVHYRTDFMPESDTITDYLIRVVDPMVENDSITFEINAQSFENTIHYTQAGTNGDIYTSYQAKNTGFRGLVLTGKNADLFSLTIPSDETGNFINNPEFETEVCMCVDASNMGHVTLEFDLRQTYSRVYNWFLGSNANELASSLRVTVDTIQVGPQFHPASFTSDVFKTHHLNLDRYAGTQFELCLQGKHFLSQQEDPSNTFGDNSYVDNIKLLDYEFISQEEFSISQLAIFPNPTKGLVNISFDANKLGSVQLKVIDTKGAVILQQTQNLETGTNGITVDLADNPKGIYMIQIQDDTNLFTQKVLLN